MSPSEAKSLTSTPLHHQPAAGGPPPLEGEDRSILAPAFICTANVEPRDGGATIVAGNQKVLAARLSDAKFFWEHDLKVPLEEQAKKLDQIVFHEKLGTVADKVERVAKLARWLVEEGIVQPSPLRGEGRPRSGQGEGLSEVAPDSAPLPAAASPRHPLPKGERVEELADLAETAARLCKADLVTGMVGEFPELQGVMGGHYARAQGHPDAVADAIRDHYKPGGQGDEVPTAPVTVAVSLADKLDTLIGFFLIDEQPSGSRDPYAIRRSALAIIRLITVNDLRLPLNAAIDFGAMAILDGFLAAAESETAQDATNKVFHDFFADRLKVQQREAGVRHDLIDAVFALGQETGNAEDDLVRLLARVRALQAFVETPEGADLLAGYKRAANILKKEGWTPLPFREGLGVGIAEGEQNSEAERSLRSLPTPSPSLEGRGISPAADDQGIPQTGEEDPFVMAEDLRDAIVGHEKLLSYTPAPEESSLIAALDSAEPRARAAVEAEDFEGAMAALATLRAPVDAFFDKVTVNDPDPAKRAARLNLLARMRDAVHQVADFSRIEG